MQILKRMFEMVGLEKHINKYLYELSGGEQQRTAIANFSLLFALKVVRMIVAKGK